MLSSSSSAAAAHVLYKCLHYVQLVFNLPDLIFLAEVTKMLTFYAQASHELVPPEVSRELGHATFVSTRTSPEQT